jgi:hypothetical protein
MKSLFTSNRRVRIIQYALFGVFIFHFTAVLHAEDLLILGMRYLPALTTQHLLAHPQSIGSLTTLIILPILIGTNEYWQWITRIGNSLRQFAAIFLSFFLIGIVVPSDELKTLEHQTARLLAIGLKDKAFEVGRNYPFSTANLQALRIQALETNDSLGNYLFSKPQHYYNIQQRRVALQQLSIPVSQGGLNYLAKKTHIHPEPQHISALLDGNLPLFTKTLPSHFTQHLKSSQIPLYYRQALLLYMRLNTHPILNYIDDATEANYRDFLDQQRKLRLQYPPTAQKTYSIAEKNKMSFFYGNTYWYYFVYEIPHQ